MKAAYFTAYDGIEGIQVGNLPIPQPKANEVQIKVEYAGVNPADWKASQGHFKERLPAEFPVILGWDLAGTISAVGHEVSDYQVGDAVFAYCRKKIMRDGTYAEYICVELNNIALMPKTLTPAQAACIPLSSLTAWQSLFDVAHLQAGEKILIPAGAGGVGSFALQFAKMKGAIVITTSSKSHHPYINTLKPDHVIDYTQEDFVQAVRKLYPEGVDVVFDTVGGTNLEKSYEVLKKKGRLVSIAGQVDTKKALEKGVEAYYSFVAPNHEQLQHIAQLIDERKLKAPPITIFPLDQVKLALQKSKEGKTEGKIVLKIS